MMQSTMTIVENKMTREQIAEGQRLARDFKATEGAIRRERCAFAAVI